MTSWDTPQPPEELDPAWEVLPSGSWLFRVHEPTLPDGAANDGTVFNPGRGSRQRWSFFGEPVVPVHYSALSPEAAVHESILHQAVPGAHLPRPVWVNKVLTALHTQRDLRLVQFHSVGLRRLGLHARNLTDTDADRYPMTVRWAAAAHAAGADGVSWMARHLNSQRAVCLFGDRVSPGDLVARPDHPDTRVFRTPADGEWLYGVALAMRVTTHPVS